MRAEGQPPAGATGGAARERAGGAGRARPSAAGRSRVAAGSDTCRAPPPQPPRPLARLRSVTQPRPTPRRAYSLERPGRVLPGCCSPSPAGEVLAGGPEERRWRGGSCGGSGTVCMGRRELEGNRPAQRADKAGATTRDREGSVRPTPAPPGWAPQPRGSTILKGGRSLAGYRVEALGGLK